MDFPTDLLLELLQVPCLLLHPAPHSCRISLHTRTHAHTHTRTHADMDTWTQAHTHTRTHADMDTWTHAGRQAGAGLRDNQRSGFGMKRPFSHLHQKQRQQENKVLSWETRRCRYGSAVSVHFTMCKAQKMSGAGSKASFPSELANTSLVQTMWTIHNSANHLCLTRWSVRRR